MKSLVRCYSSLAGKKALITGSAQGIGYGIATSLLENELEEIVIHDIVEESKIEENLDFLRGFPHSPKVHYLQFDVRDGENCRQLVRESVDSMNGLDILVNNAGIQRINRIEDFTNADWEDVVSTNLSSCFFTMSEAVGYWRDISSTEDNNERIWGRIINIASVHGVVASVHKAGYIAAKHGLIGLNKVVALELAEDTDITANCICPGWVSTELAMRQVGKLAEERGVSFEEGEYLLLSEKQPRAKFAETKDIGEMCVFLCSDYAKNITGSSLVIDGAWSAQ